MIRALLTTLLFSLTALTSRADLIWYESFNYPDGDIATNSAGVWSRISGSYYDALVLNHKLQNAATGTLLNRSADVARQLAVVADSPYTNTVQALYASLTVNCTNLPVYTNYFVHFRELGGSFKGRLFGSPGSVPGTWRLGVASGASTPSQIFPFDLAPNTDYQCVIGYDPVSLYATTLWVNPISSADLSLISNDALTAPGIIGSIVSRQAGSPNWGAFFNLTNMAVATTFDEAATNVWTTNAVAPVIAMELTARTNFVGDKVNLVCVAAGQGLGNMQYKWEKNGTSLFNPNGNSNVFSIASASVSDSGNYRMIATTPYGLSATGAAAFLWVTNPPVPPVLTAQPSNTTLYAGQTATLRVGATGALPITYQWYYQGSPATGFNVTGADTDTLIISDVRDGNGTTGTYRCDVTNPYGTTSTTNAVLSAILPPAVTIGYLRTLVDPVFFLPTNTTALWTVTGTVTSYTNMTTSGNASFYIQDGTGGIDVFYGGSVDVRPQAGDNVTVTGPLGQYSSLLELNLTTADPSHRVVTNSSGNPVPSGTVLPFSFTNSPAFGGVGSAIRQFQGSVVTFTNVYFKDGFGTATFAGGANYTLTNSAGETFALRVDSRVGTIIGQPIPQFAWQVSGVMGFYLGTTATDRSAGYQLTPTRLEDIVTTPPGAMSGTVVMVAGQPVVRWTAEPYRSYSVYRATAVTGPFLPLVSGLTFTSADGTCTDTNTTPSTRFYRICSP